MHANKKGTTHYPNSSFLRVFIVTTSYYFESLLALQCITDFKPRETSPLKVFAKIVYDFQAIFTKSSMLSV